MDYSPRDTYGGEPSVNRWVLLYPAVQSRRCSPEFRFRSCLLLSVDGGLRLRAFPLRAISTTEYHRHLRIQWSAIMGLPNSPSLIDIVPRI